MAKQHGTEQWNKARAMYIAGKTYCEVSETTGIHSSNLRERGAKEHWKDERYKSNAKALQKADEIISEKAAQNAAEAFEPLQYAQVHY